MNKEFELLDRCRHDLHATRTAARVEAKRILDEMMKPVQDATDIAVARALAAGATKSSIAAALGESRSTINERLDRATGGHNKAEAVEVYTQANPAYYIDRDDTYADLHVNWDNYGPEGITASNVLSIIRDAESDSYWFMASDPEHERNQVTDKLDTKFDGWYYEDAAKFVTQKMEES